MGEWTMQEMMNLVEGYADLMKKAERGDATEAQCSEIWEAIRRIVESWEISARQCQAFWEEATTWRGAKIELDFEQRHRANEMLERLVGADLEEFVFEFIATRDAYNKMRRHSMDKEKLAAFMFKHGFTTGHGDSLDDLLNEFDDQLSDLQKKRIALGNIRNLIEADNYADYALKMVMWKGNKLTTVGNLLATCVENVPNMELTRHAEGVSGGAKRNES